LDHFNFKQGNIGNRFSRIPYGVSPATESKVHHLVARNRKISGHFFVNPVDVVACTAVFTLD